MENLKLTPETMDSLLVLVTQYGTKVLGAVLLIFIGFWLAGKLKRVTVAALTKSQMDATLTKFTGNIVRWAILVALGISLLGMFGVQTTSFAAVIAASGLAIGLAFQGSLSNLAAGIMLLIFRPFRVGQFIRGGGETGTVNEIELFTTALDTPDNRRIIIPNSNIFGNTIENMTFHPRRRCDVNVGVSYDAGLEETRAILTEIAKNTEGVLQDPEPAIVLTGLGASSVDWVMRCWTETPDYWTVRERLLEATKKALDNNNIGIPYPQMDVHLVRDVVAASAQAHKNGDGAHLSN